MNQEQDLLLLPVINAIRKKIKQNQGTGLVTSEDIGSHLEDLKILAGIGNMRPYKQLQTQEYIYRKFTQDISEEELVWHRDENDREVDILEPTDWMFQFDNELPQTLQGKLFIPKETYHRLIKGTGYLNIRIKEY
jgi:hypothetical protein